MDDYQCKFPQILTVRVNQKIISANCKISMAVEARNFYSPVSLPKNFTEKKKNQQMVPISKREYTQFTQKPISVYLKTNNCYQSQKPTKFTQSMNSKYTQSEN